EMKRVSSVQQKESDCPHGPSRSSSAYFIYLRSGQGSNCSSSILLSYLLVLISFLTLILTSSNYCIGSFSVSSNMPGQPFEDMCMFVPPVVYQESHVLNLVKKYNYLQGTSIFKERNFSVTAWACLEKINFQACLCVSIIQRILRNVGVKIMLTPRTYLYYVIKLLITIIFKYHVYDAKFLLALS
ncbi:hypothetical protein L9F63_003054, partial [Diploptera punctata]